jgi:hypothetical protein
VHSTAEEAAIPTLDSTSDCASPKSKRTLDLRRATLEPQTGIFKYFDICSREEHLDNIRNVDEKREDEREKRRQEIVLMQLEKEANTREKNKLRKRAQRLRDKEKVSS